MQKNYQSSASMQNPLPSSKFLQPSPKSKPNFKSTSLSKPNPKSKPNPPHTSKPTRPIVWLKQCKLLLCNIKKQYNYAPSHRHNKIQPQTQLQCIRCLGQLNQHIQQMSVQYMPYILSIDDIEYMVWLFSKISMHKEICVCIIDRLFQAYFHMSMGSGGDGQQMESGLVRCMGKYVDISQFCLQLNSHPTCLLRHILLQSLGKLKQWCAILPAYHSIYPQIQEIISNNTTKQQQQQQ